RASNSSKKHIQHIGEQKFIQGLSKVLKFIVRAIFRLAPKKARNCFIAFRIRLSVDFQGL
ncbi:MAG: hypothetical protein IIW89_00940, partial [Alistipes sp.]|nr:hypothetical protein [Alistipes sp.]